MKLTDAQANQVLAAQQALQQIVTRRWSAGEDMADIMADVIQEAIRRGPISAELTEAGIPCSAVREALACEVQKQATEQGG